METTKLAIRKVTTFCSSFLHLLRFIPLTMSFVELPTPPLGQVSAMKFLAPADHTIFLASYDSSVLLYNYKKHSVAARLKAPAPVISVAHASHNTTFAGLLDGTIRQADYENMNFAQPIAKITPGGDSPVSGVSQGVNCIRALEPSQSKTSFVATTFGGTVVVFDLRTHRVSHQQDTGGKIFAMDSGNNLLTLGKSKQTVEIYDTRKFATTLMVRSTGLRYQVTDLKNTPSGNGYVLSSVDGRVSVEHYEELQQAQAHNFAFKCHRIKDKVAGEDVVYPVTGLNFHPRYGTLLTSGGDGNVCIWNLAKRKRMKLLLHEHDRPRSIMHADLTQDGTHMAICVGDDSYARASAVGPAKAAVGAVFIRELTDADCKPKH